VWRTGTGMHAACARAQVCTCDRAQVCTCDRAQVCSLRTGTGMHYARPACARVQVCTSSLRTGTGMHVQLAHGHRYARPACARAQVCTCDRVQVPRSPTGAGIFNRPPALLNRATRSSCTVKCLPIPSETLQMFLSPRPLLTWGNTSLAIVGVLSPKSSIANGESVYSWQALFLTSSLPVTTNRGLVLRSSRLLSRPK
jgi:hypothetical protein